MITLKHIVARVLSPSCYEESLRLHCSNVFDGASYAVTEVLLCTLHVNGCSLLNVFGHGVMSRLAHCCTAKDADTESGLVSRERDINAGFNMRRSLLKSKQSSKCCVVRRVIDRDSGFPVK